MPFSQHAKFLPQRFRLVLSSFMRGTAADGTVAAQVEVQRLTDTNSSLVAERIDGDGEPADVVVEECSATGAEGGKAGRYRRTETR